MNNKLIQIGAPVIAALAYGGWAAFCNWQYDMAVALKAGAVQGGFAFTSTLLLTSLVIWLLKKDNATFWGVFGQCSALLICIPAGLHLLAGTQSILPAMAPGLVIGHSYLWGLIKQQSTSKA